MIIGAPRLGTSTLGRILDQHPLFSNWVEPYYLQDHPSKTRMMMS